MEHASKMPAHRQQNKSRIAGLMLAGGRGARLGGIDKGLLDYAGLGLAEHVARRVAPQVGSLSISCNRNHQPYNALAEKYRANTTGPSLPLLVEDTALPQFSGPLAGLFSMLEVIRQSNLQARSNAIEWLFVCCCDNPRLPLNTVERLLRSLHHNEFNA
ncbi:MAG: NTP transferase domain-containing protein, partial [Pseudomonadales bacterium]|nr:NTP transferase domain-containing protein [Pseudomonadales bacterium]